MAIGDSKEDLSAYSREDLVYKAKLAEQAERCARDRRAMRCDRSIDAIDWNDERSREGLSFEPSSSAVGWMDLSVLYRRLDDDDDDDDARVVRSFRWMVGDESDDDRTSSEWIFDESRTRLDHIWSTTRG